MAKTKRVQTHNQAGSPPSISSSVSKNDAGAPTVAEYQALFEQMMDTSKVTSKAVQEIHQDHSTMVKTHLELIRHSKAQEAEVVELKARVAALEERLLDIGQQSEISELKVRVATLQERLLDAEEQVKRVASNKSASTSGATQKQACTSICLFGLPSTPDLLVGNTTSLTSTIQAILGNDGKVRKASMLGKPRPGHDGTTLIGVKVTFARERDVLTALALRKEIEAATMGHVVEHLSPEDIEVRRRRVKLCQQLRACGIWARLEDLHMLVKDPSKCQPWSKVDEEGALGMIRLKEGT